MKTAEGEMERSGGRQKDWREIERERRQDSCGKH